MKVKPFIEGAMLRDPHTMRPLPAEGGDVPDNNYWRRRWLHGELWMLEGDKWVHRLPDGSVESRPGDVAVSAPTGREPVAPLTTREGK